jgi:hypothetical protein
MNLQKIVFSAFIACTCSVGLADSTQAPGEINQSKYKVVSRTYELTTDMLRYCSGIPPAQLQKHTATIDAFWQKHPFFHEQILTSPYYEMVTSEVNQNSKQEQRPYYEAYKVECDYYQKLIQELNDSVDGENAVNEMSNTLSAH